MTSPRASLVVPTDGRDYDILRLSVQSAVNSLKGVTLELVIVGGREEKVLESLDGVAKHTSWLSSESTMRDPLRNTDVAMMNAVIWDHVTDPFIYSADDIFWIKPPEGSITWQDVVEQGRLHQGLLAEAPRLGQGVHGRAKKKTLDYLLQLPFENPLDYELHTPLVVSKSLMGHVLTNYPGGQKRSTYLNLFNEQYRKQPVLSADPKVRTDRELRVAVASGQKFVSTAPNLPIDLLRELFDERV